MIQPTLLADGGLSPDSSSGRVPVLVIFAWLSLLLVVVAAGAGCMSVESTDVAAEDVISEPLGPEPDDDVPPDSPEAANVAMTVAVPESVWKFVADTFGGNSIVIEKPIEVENGGKLKTQANSRFSIREEEGNLIVDCDKPYPTAKWGLAGASLRGVILKPNGTGVAKTGLGIPWPFRWGDGVMNEPPGQGTERQNDEEERRKLADEFRRNGIPLPGDKQVAAAATSNQNRSIVFVGCPGGKCTPFGLKIKAQIADTVKKLGSSDKAIVEKPWNISDRDDADIQIVDAFVRTDLAKMCNVKITPQIVRLDKGQPLRAVEGDGLSQWTHGDFAKWHNSGELPAWMNQKPKQKTFLAVR